MGSEVAHGRHCCMSSQRQYYSRCISEVFGKDAIDSLFVAALSVHLRATKNLYVEALSVPLRATENLYVAALSVPLNFKRSKPVRCCFIIL